MPKLVSGRVVNTRSASPSARGAPSASQIGRSNSAPSDRPIQLRCMVSTRSGQSSAVEVVEQLLGVVGDLEEPLLEVALLDQVARPLAGAVGQHLLVGQHGLAAGAPVDGGALAVGQARLEQPQEDPLGPADVVGVVALDLAAPVVDAPRRTIDDDSCSMRSSVNGRGCSPVLMAAFSAGRPKQSNPIGRQHRVAVHGAVADDQVAEGVVAHVAHVGRPRRVGVHAQHVVVRARVVVVDLVGALSRQRCCHRPRWPARRRRRARRRRQAREDMPGSYRRASRPPDPERRWAAPYGRRSRTQPSRPAPAIRPRYATVNQPPALQSISSL